MKKILLLNASVRKNGTSRSFAENIKKQGEGRGHQVQILDMIDYFDQKMPIQDLKAAIMKSDLIGIIITCYVDTLPYPVVDTLEKLVEGYTDDFKGKPIFAIAQGGMPYLDVHEPCITMSQCFAEQTEMRWLGGIICGLGTVINGKPLEELRDYGKKLIRAFGILLDDVLIDRPISDQVQKQITIKMPPVLAHLFKIGLNFIAKRDRAHRGVVDFDRMPYLE